MSFKDDLRMFRVNVMRRRLSAAQQAEEPAAQRSARSSSSCSLSCRTRCIASTT